MRFSLFNETDRQWVAVAGAFARFNRGYDGVDDV
jgi:hypothetical protein